MKYGYEVLLGLVCGAFICLAQSIQSDARVLAAVQQIDARLNNMPRTMQQSQTVNVQPHESTPAADQQDRRIRDILTAQGYLP